MFVVPSNLEVSMCFSASSSFCSAAVLSVIGFMAISKMRDIKQIMLASVPFLFALQQLSEGIIWYTAANPTGFWYTFAVYAYLTFALIIWPTWIPIAIYNLEKDDFRKTLIVVLVCMGILLSFYFSVNLIQYGATANIISNHIYYHIILPYQLDEYAILFYLFPTIGPFFISSARYLWIFGLLLSISYLITAFYWSFFLLSVWCFFAAILSIFIYKIIAEQSNKF